MPREQSLTCFSFCTLLFTEVHLYGGAPDLSKLLQRTKIVKAQVVFFLDLFVHELFQCSRSLRRTRVSLLLLCIFMTHTVALRFHIKYKLRRPRLFRAGVTFLDGLCTVGVLRRWSFPEQARKTTFIYNVDVTGGARSWCDLFLPPTNLMAFSSSLVVKRVACACLDLLPPASRFDRVAWLAALLARFSGDAAAS